jgi:hypothetical protein
MKEKMIASLIYGFLFVITLITGIGLVHAVVACGKRYVAWRRLSQCKSQRVTPCSEPATRFAG